MKNKIWKIGLSVVLVLVFLLFFWKNGEETETEKGVWNEEHTVYTNENDVEINQEEYNYLVEEYGSKDEIDNLTQDMVDASFLVAIKVEGQEFSSDLTGHVHELPEGFEKIGTIQAFSKFRYGVMDQLEELEATANMRFISSVGKEVYYHESYPETILVEGDGESYYIFTLDGTETTLEDIHTGSH